MHARSRSWHAPEHACLLLATFRHIPNANPDYRAWTRPHIAAVLGTAAASRLAPAAPAPGPTGKPTSGNATAIAKQKQPSGTTPSTGEHV